MGFSLGFLSYSIGLYFCFVSVPYCLNDCSFVVNLKTGRLIPPAPFFSLRTFFFSYLGIFSVSTQIVIFLNSSSVKNAIGNLIGIALNLNTVFGSIVIFTILLWKCQKNKQPNLKVGKKPKQTFLHCSYPGTWNISPSIYGIFDFFH